MEASQNKVVKMMRFLKKHPKTDSEEREKLKKELFKFTRCLDHGFPNKPSALAYDPKLKLLAIGCKSGAVNIFGAPGVKLTGWHINDVAVNHLYFLPEQGRLISLCSDNSLHLWEINVDRHGATVLEEKNTYEMESTKLKNISACCLTPNSEQLLLGTEGGNIHILDVTTFTLLDQIIYQDVVMQNVPEDFKVNPGAVEAIAVHPSNSEQFLIGYNRGLIVLWDNKESNAEKTYNGSQQLESLTWHRGGEEFMSSHADGSYIIWTAAESTTPKEPASTPYGPFPCKGISKIIWETSKLDPFIIFSGGMPRASYGDKHTISVMQGKSHQTFDFTSRVIDFVTLSSAGESDTESDHADYDDPHTLVILVEEELIVIDLMMSSWPLFRLPYMNSLHSSAITCSQHIGNIPEQLWTKICDAGDAQMKNTSTRDWPITGGQNVAESTSRDLLLTGHEDGTVRFWDASGTSLKLLYKLSTAPIFGSEVGGQDQNNDDEEEPWPPFKKVGSFDPYSDDPRLGIQKISLCPLSETLIAAGTAGQVIILQMEREERKRDVKSVTVNIVSDRDGFVWKGHEALSVHAGEVSFASGYQPSCVMQLSPPAACTALAFHSEWQLVAAGTAHGFALFDYVQDKEVLTRCTLNPSDLSGTQETTMSRPKSFKKSLRDSFRRLRKRRSERRKKPEDVVKTDGEADAPVEGATAAPPSTTPAEDVGRSSPERKPVERQIEARSGEEQRASLVRCLYFTETFVSSGQSHTPTLWVGTNAGHVYIHTIVLPSSDKRASDALTSIIAKEIKIRHKAPVIAVSVIDKNCRLLPDALEVSHERAKSPDLSGDHQVVICSEEQFKIFTLPGLKPVIKTKLTAVDGSRVRRISYLNFKNKSDETNSEFDIGCLTNQGELSVYSIPQLRKQIRVSCIRKEDINGISSFVFTRNGQGFYLSSSSEYSHVSLSAHAVTEVTCTVELKEGMRPPPPEPTADETIETIGDVTVELLERSDEQNDSRADTTADITVDSVTVNPEIIVDATHVTEQETSSDATAPTEAPAPCEAPSAPEVELVAPADDPIPAPPQVNGEPTPIINLDDLRITDGEPETAPDGRADSDPALNKHKTIVTEPEIHTENVAS